MGNKSHLQHIAQGVSEWNAWRAKNPLIEPDLSAADLKGMNLQYVDLHEAILVNANLAEADLTGANLKKAKLRRAKLMNAIFHKANLDATLLANASLCGAQLNQGCKLGGASLVRAHLMDAHLEGAILRGGDLTGADLSGAHLSGADLSEANLSGAELTGADLQDADLTQASLVGTTVTDAIFTGCAVYGVSVWNLQGEPKDQSNLNISDLRDNLAPAITVDDLEVAQFMYLLTKYEKLRNVIDTITSKVVLILGRFSDEQMTILTAILNKLREYDYVPVRFDFDKPESRSFIATVSTIAHMARFVIANFTDPKIVLEEVPHIASIGVPIRPILQAGCDEPSELSDLRNVYKTVLDTFFYHDIDDLIRSLEEKVIEPANALRKASIESNRRESEKIVQAIREKRK
jgi:uncharacterized protein YjbI with pentapeptide repeats